MLVVYDGVMERWASRMLVLNRGRLTPTTGPQDTEPRFAVRTIPVSVSSIIQLFHMLILETNTCFITGIVDLPAVRCNAAVIKTR